MRMRMRDEINPTVFEYETMPSQVVSLVIYQSAHISSKIGQWLPASTWKSAPILLLSQLASFRAVYMYSGEQAMTRDGPNVAARMYMRACVDRQTVQDRPRRFTGKYTLGTPHRYVATSW